MDRQEIIRKVNVAVLAEFDVEEGDLNPDAKLGDDLGLDSLDGIDLVVAIEKEFKQSGVKIEEQQARSMKTLNDIYNHVESFLRAKSQ